MQLGQTLSDLDEHSPASLGAIYERCAERTDFAREAVRLLGTRELQTAASWLLKHHLETGGGFKTSLTGDLAASLPLLDSWEARLHVLQCLPYLTVDATEKAAFERFLRSNLGDSNKFVRAWAYSGMHVFATQYPELAEEVRNLFDWARMNEAPSVKARIRRISR